MNIPRETREANTKFDRWVQEQQPDTLALRFYETTPAKKQLFKVTTLEAGFIDKITASFGAMDPSANGYIHVWMTKIQQDPTVAPATIQQASQIIWEAMSNAGFKNVISDLAPHYLYFDVNESFWIYLVSNIPAGQVLGTLNLHWVPTHK